MSDALIPEFSGVTVDQYNALNKILNLNPTTGEGDSPTGLISHTGASGDGGAFQVLEVWDSQASQGSFMASRLGPALGQVGLPEPSRIEWFSVVGNHTH
jgi:hypothetical protein